LGEGVVDLFFGDPLRRISRLVEVLFFGAVAHHAGVRVLGVFLGHSDLLCRDAKAIRGCRRAFHHAGASLKTTSVSGAAHWRWPWRGPAPGLVPAPSA